MMWDLPEPERSAISVLPLPGNVTSAGEWYLAVPAYSAAPELAWEIIHMITSPDRELQRIYHGVGLPTRESYYRHSGPATPASLVSPFFHISRPMLKDLVESAFQRSRFPCYQKMTDTISAHLQRILELPAATGQLRTFVEEQVNSVIDHLLESIEYIRDSTKCSGCRSGQCAPIPLRS
jgi:ABC-type glycerol-3-phosphate transport system substrate-binding protein